MVYDTILFIRWYYSEVVKYFTTTTTDNAQLLLVYGIKYISLVQPFEGLPLLRGPR